MTDFENIREEARNKWQQRAEERGRGGRVWTGLFIVIIGVLALLKSFAFPLPNWLFSWQMLLIAIGLFVGLRHGFRKGGWFVPVIIGTAFLLNDYVLGVNIRKHLWPAILILVGILFILRPKSNYRRGCWQEKKNRFPNDPSPDQGAIEGNVSGSEDDYIDSTAVFGGNKKNIFTKNFRGGDVVNIFGGSELNLSQADIQGKATLEITAIFGGTSLIVPANWTVKSEAVTIFGGIQDKRPMPAINSEHSGKILVLKGTVLFGGIDIKSY